MVVMQRPPAKFKTSINSLPLIHKEVMQLVRTYRGTWLASLDLQQKIKNQSQLNQTNRLQ